MFQGAMTAIVTPFRDGCVDEQTFRELIDFQIESGIHGIVPCGTTGESATLTFAEHERVIEICVEQVRGRVPVVAGTGSNNTEEAIRLTRPCEEGRRRWRPHDHPLLPISRPRRVFTAISGKWRNPWIFRSSSTMFPAARP